MLPTKALPLWNLPPETKTTLLAKRENRVYRLDPPNETSTVLRIHRQHYRTDAELNSELQWMAYLAEQGMIVPTPIPTIHNALIETVDDYQIDRLSWLDGKVLGKTGQPLVLDDRLETFRRIGETIAHLHQLTDAWEIPENFRRPSWDLQGLLGEQPLWGRFWENPRLSIQQTHLLTAAREKARHSLSELDGTLDYGLIHADLVRENILFKGSDIQLLDFDDSGFGYRLFELATVLLKNHPEPDYEQLQQALLEGYLSIRPLAVEHLPLFLLLRACTYVGWIIPRLEETGGHERCERFINTATALAEEYLHT